MLIVMKQGATRDERRPYQNDFVKMMRESARFDSIAFESLTFGIAYLYIGVTA